MQDHVEDCLSWAQFTSSPSSMPSDISCHILASLQAQPSAAMALIWFISMPGSRSRICESASLWFCLWWVLPLSCASLMAQLVKKKNLWFCLFHGSPFESEFDSEFQPSKGQSLKTGAWEVTFPTPSNKSLQMKWYKKAQPSLWASQMMRLTGSPQRAPFPREILIQ